MILRSFFILATASLLIPIGSSMAFSQLESARMGANPDPTTKIAQLPPPCLPPVMVPPSGTPEPPWAKDLNLSTDQQERIKTNHQQARIDVEGLLQQLQAADNQMRSLLESNASPDQLRQQHLEIQKLHQQLDDKHFEMMLADNQVLTPDQRAQLGKLMQQHQGRLIKSGVGGSNGNYYSSSSM